jgi:hypothetical protein
VIAALWPFVFLYYFAPMGNAAFGVRFERRADNTYASVNVNVLVESYRRAKQTGAFSTTCWE